MIFKETDLSNVFVIELELVEDNRGFFARCFCEKEFEEHSIYFKTMQCNISYNKQKGTLRGLHYQTAPYYEAKLVHCIKGSIYDVIVDLRENSKTFKKWISVELSEMNKKMIYIPERFAHGFLTLEDDTEVFYQMSEFYHQEYARGVRWDDKSFNVKWPYMEKYIISNKDQNWEEYKI